MRTESEMTELDDLFAEARRSAAGPSDAFMARVLADAMAEQPEPARIAPAPARAAPGRVGAFDWLAGLFGGGGVLAGMGAVAAAGLLVGYVQPAPVTAVAGAFLSGTSIETVELIPNLSGLVGTE
jgi:hypothetical protein